jgi:hypothetical protein
VPAAPEAAPLTPAEERAYVATRGQASPAVRPPLGADPEPRAR